MALDKRPARELTSREIAKIISGLLTGFVDWCGATPVCLALDHLVEHREAYKQTFRELESIMNPPRGEK